MTEPAAGLVGEVTFKSAGHVASPPSTEDALDGLLSGVIVVEAVMGQK
jgi:hypothetical protein